MNKKYGIDSSKGMEIGLYSLGDHIANPMTGERISQQQRINEIIEAAKFADEAGIDVFGVGESHQRYFVGQANQMILSAIATQTKNIKLTSSVSVLSTNDPVRVYEEYATLDLISNGRAEIVAGRGSRVGVYELLGFDLKDYEELFEEKMHLLKLLNEATPNERINWEGNFRAPLQDVEILPQPVRGHLPVWRAVGGPAESAIKAGLDGIPMMLTTLAGPAPIFKRSVDAYRLALTEAGYDEKEFPLATTSLFYVAETGSQARKEMYPFLNAGWEAIRGGTYPKQHFAQSQDSRDTLMVGGVNEIIEKMLYQYELYGHQRFMAQIDFGGVPLDLVKKNIELIATKVMPEVKKYTRE
ncbi:hypothetical protein A5819_001124 [Enterococcus sp. 7E2_DIV0204]|uniref:LLM class flavin-dependent oxidoreductase n=1 Tax=unclassified Enterococcus TaxID=2608891 RepID=UPI000A339596|nr:MULTISPECIES: LLM class flavin-dependent oxidoreductase [unclassified Enterococcus]OTN88643.1 hypothetical protein A5819_001124 [Enterococcus sp. 7E2_DIV0204]OTP51112.1 hypothetical protein A5884_000298 [Enterococcus sp. 7D2_DIV0200]